MSCSTTPTSQLHRYEFRRPEMGLPCRIGVYANSSGVASNAAEAAFSRIHVLNQILTDYDSDSELSRLSQTSGQNRDVKVSEDLWRVLWRAQQIAASSEGAFDITVGPLVNLWRYARQQKKFPRPDLLTDAKARVGYKNLVLNPQRNTVRLLLPEMRLDVGGVEKGYALDAALKVLRAHGTPHALVTGGGDMAAGDPPPGKKGWRIEIAPLDVICFGVKAILLDRFLNREDRWQWLVFDNNSLRSRATRFLRFAHDQRDDLAVIRNLVVREQDLVVADRADIV